MGCATSKSSRLSLTELEKALKRISGKEKLLDDLIKHHEELILRQNEFLSSKDGSKVKNQESYTPAAAAELEHADSQENDHQFKDTVEKRFENIELALEKMNSEILRSSERCSPQESLKDLAINYFGQLAPSHETSAASQTQLKQTGENDLPITLQEKQALIGIPTPSTSSASNHNTNAQNIIHRITEEHEEEEDENRPLENKHIRGQGQDEVIDQWNKLMEAFDESREQQQTEQGKQIEPIYSARKIEVNTFSNRDSALILSLQNPTALRIDQIGVLEFEIEEKQEEEQRETKKILQQGKQQVPINNQNQEQLHTFNQRNNVNQQKSQQMQLYDNYYKNVTSKPENQESQVTSLFSTILQQPAEEEQTHRKQSSNLKSGLKNDYIQQTSLKDLSNNSEKRVQTKGILADLEKMLSSPRETSQGPNRVSRQILQN